AHRVLEVEEIGAVPKGVELGGDRAHDGDDGAAFEPRVDGLQAIEAFHFGSSHIRSRWRSKATGDSEAWASVIAWSIFGCTSSGRRRSACAMCSASSTGRVYLPPRSEAHTSELQSP